MKTKDKHIRFQITAHTICDEHSFGIMRGALADEFEQFVHGQHRGLATACDHLHKHEMKREQIVKKTRRSLRPSFPSLHQNLQFAVKFIKLSYLGKTATLSDALWCQRALLLFARDRGLAEAEWTLCLAPNGNGQHAHTARRERIVRLESAAR